MAKESKAEIRYLSFLTIAETKKQMKITCMKNVFLPLVFIFFIGANAFGQVPTTAQSLNDDQHYYFSNIDGVGTNNVKYHTVNKISNESVEEINKLFKKIKSIDHWEVDSVNQLIHVTFVEKSTYKSCSFIFNHIENFILKKNNSKNNTSYEKK